MAANSTPVFGLTPVLAAKSVSAANTNRDGTGTIVDLVTGGTNGTRIEKVRATAQVTTTAGAIHLFLYDPGASAYKYFRGISVLVTVPSGSTISFEGEIARSDGRPVTILPSGWKLAASTLNAEAFTVSVEGADF